jgi:hypothetical protein
MTWWTETFLKPNGGTFKEFRNLKNVLHLARTRTHTHTHYTLVCTSACHPISHLWTRRILHLVKKSQNTTDLVHVKMATVWKLSLKTTHISAQWCLSHSADHHQENSGANGLIFVTFVTRQHSQIVHTYRVVNTGNYACSLVGIWLLFMSVSKHTVAVTLKKKLKSTHLHKSTEVRTSVTYKNCTTILAHSFNSCVYQKYW